jgi:hypothetical protein
MIETNISFMRATRITGALAYYRMGVFLLFWDAFLHDRKYRLDGLVKLLPSFLTEVSKIAHWLVVGRL